MTIDSLDKVLIRMWHTGWHPETLDQIAPWWRDRDTWIIFYVLLVGWMIYKAKFKGLLLAAVAGLTVGAADFVAAGIIKPLVQRPRPCNVEGLSEHLDLLTGCSSAFSFPSAHAANHLALAMFLSLTCFKTKRWAKWIIFVWAISIAIAQVYVGRHYFSDILVGGIIGCILAGISATLYNKFIGLSPSFTNSQNIGSL